jgi:16S rRNA (adenine1518-N6/adenine1519-N6)-dimethyltransferase
MVQAEVGEKIKRDAHKKSYLYRLLNYAYHVEYLKTVPAKAFNPPPKVKSCLISLVKKSELPQLPFAKLVSFLDAVAPYSRKTLGKISKILEKHPNKVAFSIPEHIKGKRLEAVYREELEEIMG